MGDVLDAVLEIFGSDRAWLLYPCDPDAPSWKAVMLSGFWLRPDLEGVEVSIHSWPGYVAGEEVYEEVRQSLVDLAQERPEAMQLMRGRTFARAVH